MIEYIENSLAAQAGRSVKLIEGTIEPTAVEATATPALEPPKPKSRLMLAADTAVRPRERQAAQGVIACGDVTSRCGGSVALRRAASCRWQRNRAASRAPRHLRSARISSPRMGCTLEIPFLTR